MNEIFLYETAGLSMWPFLRGTERLIIKKIPCKEVGIGDIVAYEAPDINKIVCHRLVKKNKCSGTYSFYMRGDNSLQGEWVSETRYIGKAIAVVKGARTVNLCAVKQRVLNPFIIAIAPLLARLNMLKTRFIKRHKIHEK